MAAPRTTRALAAFSIAGSLFNRWQPRAFAGEVVPADAYRWQPLSTSAGLPSAKRTFIHRTCHVDAISNPSTGRIGARGQSGQFIQSAVMQLIDVRGRRLLDSEYRELRRRTNRGELVRIRPGVFVAPGRLPPSEEHRRRIQAAAPSLGSDSVVSHTSAAVMHGLPVLSKGLQLITVTRQRSNGERTNHIHARRSALTGDEISFIDGIPVTSLQRTVLDAATTLPFGEALAIADCALRNGLDQDAISRSGRGRTAIDRIRRYASPLSESIGESLSRAAFITAGLPVPTLQHDFYAPSGVHLGRGDFFWEDEGVIGEFDGLSKYGFGLLTGKPTLETIRREKEREGGLRDLGHDVIRWIWGDLEHGDRVVNRVRLALARRNE